MVKKRSTLENNKSCCKSVQAIVIEFVEVVCVLCSSVGGDATASAQAV